MTLGGYVCMLGATGTVTLLFGWCCWKIAFVSKCVDPEAAVNDRRETSENRSQGR